MSKYNDCRNIVNNIRKNQIQLVDLYKEIDKESSALKSKLDRHFRDKWSETFGQVPQTFYIMVDAGRHTKDWHPMISIYSVGNKYLTNYHTWTHASSWLAGNYIYMDQYKAVESPVDISQLNQFCVDFEKDTGIEVDIRKVEIINKPNYLTNIEENE